MRGGMAAAQRGEYLLGGLTPQIVEDGVEWALGMGDGDTGTKIVLADRDGVIGAGRSVKTFFTSLFSK